MESFSGLVVHGKKLGRTIGFPTCNLQVDEAKSLQVGVYSVYVELEGKGFYGVMNIGMRPTINDGFAQSVEVHLLDFNEQIYGQQLVVKPLQFIRHEQKFDGLPALVAQLQKDVAFARQSIQLAV